MQHQFERDSEPHLVMMTAMQTKDNNQPRLQMVVMAVVMMVR
jgi:hypothetical protein